MHNEVVTCAEILPRSFMFSKFSPQKKCTDLRMNTEEFYFIAFFPVWPPPHRRREIRGYR